MAVRTKIAGDVAILKVKGELMGGPETGEVLDGVQKVISRGIRHVVLDFSKVRWMNSHGMGMLMACYSRLSKTNGKILIAGITAKVEELMEMTKIHRLFDQFSSVSEALKALESSIEK